MTLKGIPASPGFAIGEVWVHRPSKAPAPTEREGRAPDPAAEVVRLDEALEAARLELRDIVAKVGSRVGAEEAAIFESHLALLDDPEIVDAAKERITAEGLWAEAAVKAVIQETAAIFDAMDDDDYLKERAADIRDVGGRIQQKLAKVVDEVRVLPEGCIVVAHDLTPSDTAKLDPDKVRAFAVDTGGPTSHSAILAKAMGLAAVVGLGDLSTTVKDGDLIIVDGQRGEVHLHPGEAVLAEYRAKGEAWQAEKARLQALAGADTYTKAGRRVVVAANIGSPAEAKASLAFGAEGIGLFRTEFLYMGRDSAPGEDEQYEAYATVLKAMEHRPVVIRTLDIGGDKEVPYLGLAPEANPFLGLRAIRLCLRDRPLFKTQLRALLRASVHGNLRIMFPMIGSLGELREAKAVLEECRGELRRESIPVNPRLDVGIMIEIPSAALMAQELAAECDFFSIGTNDLTQYTLAVDRLNETVAPLYDAMSPAVLRLVKLSIDAAHSHGIDCGMCGELAGNPGALGILVDYGLDEFSMGAPAIPKAKEIISSY